MSENQADTQDTGDIQDTSNTPVDVSSIAATNATSEVAFAGTQVPAEAIFHKTINFKRQRLCDTAYLAKPVRRTSVIWDHGIHIVDKENKQKYWVCRLCK